MNNPKDILNTLHLIRAGLEIGLLTKEEVIDWAYNIIAKDNNTDIFFIDLALSSSKSTSDIVLYFSDYLNFENPVVQGRPLLGLLYKKFISKEISLERTVSKLYNLIRGTVLTEKEEGYIYSIDDNYHCAIDNIYGTLETVNAEVEKFLSFYKEYSLDSFDQWERLTVELETTIDADINRLQEEDRIANKVFPVSDKPWWKFW